MAPTSEPLETIGNYNVVEMIAQGGVGAVYKARHWQTGQIVAIKVLASSLVRDPVVLKRFQQEFRAASRIDHPNIVRSLDFGLDGKTPYLVMEYVDGPSLGVHIREHGRLPEEQAVNIIVQIAQALHQAHQQGIIHRDVKPDNILLAASGLAKLTDLGLVKDAEAEQNLTRTGRGLGTPHFMAPEQFKNARGVDARCDIYSLGATLYMALTDEVPFDAMSPVQVWMRKMRNEITPPRELAPQLSERVDRAIRRSIHSDPRIRPRNCLDFIAELTGKRASAPAAAVEASVQTLPTGPKRLKPSSRGERRGKVRYACDLQGVCRAVGGDPESHWPFQLKDLSASGVALELTRRYERGTTLLLDFQTGQPETSCRLIARVVWVRTHDAPKWLLGCAFGYRLDDDDVQILLQASPARSPVTTAEARLTKR